MRGVSRKDERNIFEKLRARLRELQRAPLYTGRKNIENIHIEDLVIELAAVYCDLDYVIKKLEELRHDRQNNKR